MDIELWTIIKWLSRYVRLWILMDSSLYVVDTYA